MNGAQFIFIRAPGALQTHGHQRDLCRSVPEDSACGRRRRDQRPRVEPSGILGPDDALRASTGALKNGPALEIGLRDLERGVAELKAWRCTASDFSYADVSDTGRA